MMERMRRLGRAPSPPGSRARAAGRPGLLASMAAFFALMVAMASISSAQDTERTAPANLILSTAGTGGAFHQGGVSLSALIKIKLLPEEQIDLATRNSTGSLENITRLENGSSDFAIVQALLGHYAQSGTGIAAPLGAQRDLRAVTMLWPNVEHFIIRKSLASTGTIADFAALKGKRVSLGRERSAIESNRVLLTGLGLDIGRDLDQTQLSFRPSVAAFQRGEIDGLSLPASTPVPAFNELMTQLGPDAVLLRWTEEQLRQADGDLGLWSPITLPANTYAEQTEPLETIAQPNFLAVRADVDDEIVYAVTRAIFENLPFLTRLHAPFQFLTPETAVAGLPVPLHPGARRYFEEIRLDLDDAVIAENDYRLFGDDLPSASAIRSRIGQDVVELMATEDGTSGLMIDDLLDVISGEGAIRILPIRGRGAAHNLADLVYLSGVDVGVLQVDALERERGRGVYPDLTGNIRYIAKWADTEVHLLVRDDILDIKDLRNQPVNFGPEGSGGEVTASLLFNRLRLSVKQTSFGHAQALAKLKAGEIAGLVHVAPKPVPLFQSIEVRDGLRFLSLPEGAGSDLYRPADLTVNDYPTLVFGEQTIRTLAVPQILAAYNWPADHERYPPIAEFVDRFLESLGDLQDPSRHAKWRDVDPAFELEGWRRHPAVDTYLQRLRTAGGPVTGRGGPLARTDDGGVARTEDETQVAPSDAPAEPSGKPAQGRQRSPRGPVF
ncbi:MAG: TAXI family TRAP transporter solute-binding subunit [Geminicoccaceae bacterium]